MRTLIWACCAWLSLACVADDQPPPITLANVYEPAGNLDPSGYWMSEKLDGVRGYWDGRRLLTRSGNVIRTPPWFTTGWPGVPLDGEVWAGRGRFEQASSAARTREPDDDTWRQIRFMVFDLPDHTGRFTARLSALNALIEQAQVPWLQAVPQRRVANRAELDAELRRVVAAGGEGLMLHRGSSRYRAERTNDLLKYKLYQDAEAMVVGHLPGNGKYENMLGALLVERPDGLRFRIGTGFTDAERRHPPPIGSRVTYAYNGLTASGIPRFARFVRIREEAAQTRRR